MTIIKIKLAYYRTIIKDYLRDVLFSFLIGADYFPRWFWAYYSGYLKRHNMDNHIESVLKYLPQKINILGKNIEKINGAWIIRRRPKVQKIYYEVNTLAAYADDNLKKHIQEFMCKSEGVLPSEKEIMAFMEGIRKGKLRVGKKRYAIGALPKWNDKNCGALGSRNELSIRRFDDPGYYSAHVSGKLKSSVVKVSQYQYHNGEIDLKESEALKPIALKIFKWLYIDGGKYAF